MGWPQNLCSGHVGAMLAPGSECTSRTYSEETPDPRTGENARYRPSGWVSGGERRRRQEEKTGEGTKVASVLEVPCH